MARSRLVTWSFVIGGAKSDPRFNTNFHALKSVNFPSSLKNAVSAISFMFLGDVTPTTLAGGRCPLPNRLGRLDPPVREVSMLRVYRRWKNNIIER